MGLESFQMNVNATEADLLPKPLDLDYYPCMITDVKENENKSKTGRYVLFTLKIMNGPEKGRVFTDCFNYELPDYPDLQEKSCIRFSLALKTLNLAPTQVFSATNQMIDVHAGSEFNKRKNEYEVVTKSYRPYTSIAAAASTPQQQPGGFQEDPMPDFNM